MSDIISSTQIVLTTKLAAQLQPQFTGLWGAQDVLARLLPQLVSHGIDKKQQPLQKVDHYMLEETEELYRRLRRFCQLLEIDDNIEFKVARGHQGLQIIGEFAARNKLTELINNDRWFVGSFQWLQPNYTSLAHSFEMLEFSYAYEHSPAIAAQKYAHFDQSDKGMAFTLSHAHGSVNAQVESPLNLYCV